MTDEKITPAERRRRALVIPHRQVSEVRTSASPAGNLLATVSTACGQDVPVTLATLRGDLVRCPECQTPAGS